MNKKILIIAIIIIAITIVMFVVLGGNSTIISDNNSGLNTEEKERQEKIQSHESFNKKFTQYEGENVSGKEVNELIKMIRASRFAFTSGEIKQIVSLKGLKLKDGLSSTVDETKNFSVECKYDDEGYVKEIYVYEK